MAHLEKFTRKAIGKVSGEAFRKSEKWSAYKNNVDLEKSHLNYTINDFSREEVLKKIDERCNEISNGKKLQTQTNVVGSWVLTCPKALRGNSEQEKLFFEKSYEFISNRYGEKNVIEGVVHYDETSPHMTVYVVPACVSRKTGRETISSASMFTKKDLSTFHEDLEREMEKTFHMSGLVLNGRTKGNYTLEELKQRTKDAEARADLIKKISAYNEGVKKLNEQTRKLNKREYDLNVRESEILALEEKLANERENLQQDIENRLKTKLDRLTATENRLSELEQEEQDLKEEIEDLEKEIATLTQTKQDIMTSKQKKDYEDKRKEFERRMEELGSSGIEIER